MKDQWFSVRELFVWKYKGLKVKHSKRGRGSLSYRWSSFRSSVVFSIVTCWHASVNAPWCLFSGRSLLFSNTTGVSRLGEIVLSSEDVPTSWMRVSLYVDVRSVCMGWCLCMCVCACMGVCVCVQACMRACIYVHAGKHACMFVCVYMHVYVYACVLQFDRIELNRTKAGVH